MASEDASQVRWVELSTRCERERYTALSEELAKAGIANEVAFIEAPLAEFEPRLSEVKSEFAQIRIGGGLREIAYRTAERMPSTLLTVRSADAYVCERGEWWPRNFLVDGLQQAIAEEFGQLDLSGGVFVLGANADARAVITALFKVGYRRFSISDNDEDVALALTEELQATHFGVQFQAVPRHLVTQLPGVNSVAVNTLPLGTDDGILGELFYFNFLKPGGIWLDLPLVPRNPALATEAASVGATVEESAGVLARVDFAWAQAAFGERAKAIDLSRLRERYIAISEASVVVIEPPPVE